MNTESFIIIGQCIITVVAISLILTWLPAICIKQVQLASLRRRCRNRLAITFDDGPGALLTPALVELFRRHKAKATFFLVGFRAQRHPDSCDLLKQSGHELGCHTHMHKKPWRVAPWTTAIDAEKGYRSMSRWLDSTSSFRPPFGKLTTWSWFVAWRRGAQLCWWTCDGCDTAPTLPETATVVQRVFESGGGVVLLHSHDRGEDRKHYVLQLTEELLLAARRHNFEVCTMAQLLHSKIA
jgi:peptidoglycan-N-acetylglucosamine deacetylase